MSESAEPQGPSSSYDDRLSLLSRLSVRISASLEVATVLEEVVVGACILTGARYGALGVFDSTGHVTQFITHGLSEAQRARIGSLPEGRGVLGLLHRLQQPLRLTDLSQHGDSSGFPANHPPMHSFIGTPIRFGDEHLGNLYLTEKANGGEFTQADEQILVLFAAQAAMAVHNAQLHEYAESERRRLETVLRTSPVGVFVADRTGHVHLVNDEGLRLVGQTMRTLQEYEQGLIHLRPDGTPCPPDQVPLRRALLRGETVREEEMWLQSKDGTTTIPTLINAAPLIDDTGKVSEAVAIIQDISRLKAVEQLKDEFLSMVSHDLKSPLAVVKGLCSAAMMNATDDTVQLPTGWLRTIDAEVDWLTELVNNLLDLSRLESGSMPLDLEECYPADLVGEALQHVQFSTGSRRQIDVDVPDDLPAVMGDYNQLKRVLLNFISNAEKYSDAPTPITVHAFQDDGGRLCIAVQDAGIGLDEEERAHVFEKFYRSPQHTQGQRQNPNGQRQGSGLGLAVCEAIVQAHGGEVWVQSTPGQGSTFGFTLPVEAVAAGC